MLEASQGGFSHPRNPKLCPRQVVKPQALEKGACVSHEGHHRRKQSRRETVGRPQQYRGKLRQAEGRSSEAAGNAGSLPRKPLSSQNPPGLSQAGCKVSGFGTGCLYLMLKYPTSENGAGGWQGWVTGTQGDVEAGRREKQQDRRKYSEPPKKASSIPEAPRAVPGGL